MKIIILLLIFCFSINYSLASVTYKEPDLKANEKSALEKYKLSNGVCLKDSTEKSSVILKKWKNKTGAHKLGLMSFLGLCLSYLLIIVDLSLNPFSSPIAGILIYLGFICGIIGFLLSFLSLIKYDKEKNKKGRLFPILSILMTILPIASIFLILRQASKKRNGLR